MCSTWASGFSQKQVTSTLGLKEAATDWSFYVICCSLWGMNWMIYHPIRTKFFPFFFLSQAGRVLCVCDWDSTTIVDWNELLEETTLLEEKAQCHCNNSQHCHNDWEPDFRDWYSGWLQPHLWGLYANTWCCNSPRHCHRDDSDFVHLDERDMRRRHTGWLQQKLWCLNANTQR